MRSKLFKRLVAITLCIGITAGAINLPLLSEALPLKEEVRAKEIDEPDDPVETEDPGTEEESEEAGQAEVYNDPTGSVEVSTWSELQYALNHSDGETPIVLTANITAPANSQALYVSDKDAIIDLKTWDINRDLEYSTASFDGYVIRVNGKNLTIEGSGRIMGGYCTETGGGILVDGGGSLILNGGNVTGNHASNGGGIYCENGSVTISGGSVQSNTAGINGGGINVGTNGSLTLTQGFVSCNEAGTASIGLGGGIFVGDGASVSIDGAIPSLCIRGNTLHGKEGIENNLYLPQGKTITIVKAPGVTSDIGISLQDTPDYGEKVIFATGVDGDISSLFSPDDQGYYLIRKYLGNLVIAYERIATWVSVQTALDFGGILDEETNEYIVRLTTDIEAGSNEEALSFNYISHPVVLDLNGHKLNRHLTEPENNGYVLRINGGKLVIRDSSTEGTGVITGGNNSGDGGGIYVDATARLTLESGTISGNSSNTFGGGVYVNSSGYLFQQNGVITDNTARAQGGGVFMTGENYTVSGNANVTGNKDFAGLASNVFLQEGEVITVSNELRSGAQIGVSYVFPVTDPDPAVVTSGFADLSGADAHDIFEADDKADCLRLNDNEEVTLYHNGHIHDEASGHGRRITRAPL
ncbi:hypothetical protein SAMN02910456_01686 [Ruminococcaceae bacterium YRB3002]|nr:hypothetical protein SAMN02910456_01686 [Ruminococcaceae bacterium YRB3002]